MSKKLSSEPLVFEEGQSSTVLDKPVSSTPVFKNWYNAHLFDDPKEFNSNELVTIPDQTMSIMEILTRHSNGIVIPEEIGYFDDNPELGQLVPPNWDQMDLSERYDYMRSAAQHADEIVANYQDWLHKLENEKLEKEIEERINQRNQQTLDVQPISVTTKTNDK